MRQACRGNISHDLCHVDQQLVLEEIYEMTDSRLDFVKFSVEVQNAHTVTTRRRALTSNA